MLGSLIVFAVAVLIVSTYMAIVHKFLKSAEEPADYEQPKVKEKRPAIPAPSSGRPQLAH